MFIARQRIIETAIYQAKCPKTFKFASSSSTLFLISADAAVAAVVSRQDVSTFVVLKPVLAKSEHVV